MKGKGKRPSISRVKPKKSKPPAKESMEAKVPRKLGEKELYFGARRLVTKVQLLRSLQERKRKLTRELNQEIKEADAEVGALMEQLETGVEMVEQGDLFVDGSTKDTKVPSQDEASRALAQVEQATSPAAQFVASLGERNGLDEHTLRRRLWDWCADKGIRGKDAHDALWLSVQELVAKPAGGEASEPQATA